MTLMIHANMKLLHKEQNNAETTLPSNSLTSKSTMSLCYKHSPAAILISAFYILLGNQLVQ